MIPHPNRPSTFEPATAVQKALVKIRHGGRLALEALQRAYDAHLERSQMRLAPARPRSWREIPRAGACRDYD